MLYRIGVVAHTTRAKQAKHLAHTVKAEFVSIDNGVLGCDENHHNVAYHLANMPSTYSVILEDDAEPVPDFRDQLDHALPLAPTPIISLYAGRERPPHWQPRYRKAFTAANNIDASWLISTHLLHAVGYAIRTELLPSLLSFSSLKPSDQHITAWAKQHGHCISYTVPSLIDHIDGPTIVVHPDGAQRTPGRKAWQVGGRQHWTSQAVTMP